MKEINHYIILLFSLLLYSCSPVNEETLSQSFNLTLSINVTSTYKGFKNLNDSITTYLNDSADKQILITTLLYSQNGALSDSICFLTNKQENITCQFDDLQKDNYWAITIETIIDKDDNGRSDYWRLADIANLNTVKIECINSALPSNSIIGIAYTEVDLNTDKSITVMPKPIGSIINSTWEGFGETEFGRIALYQKNRPNGYQLNPLLAENERPLKDNDNNTWECIGYSDVLNNHTNSWFIIGNMDMEYTWGYCLSEDGKDSDNFMVYPTGLATNHLAIDNGKEYAAHCRYKTINDGDIFFGNSDEYIDWLEALEPLSFSYKEPCFEYGMDFHEVLKYMCRFSGQTIPIMQDEDYYYITYRNICSAEKMEYWFFSNTDELYLANVYFNKDKVQKSELESFILNLGYFVWRYSPSGCYYLSNDEKKRLFLTETDTEWIVQYY